jgi:hypothetical protein
MSTLAAAYQNHLFPALLVIIFILCAPYNHQPAIKPQQRSQLSSNITRMIQQSPTSPTSPDYSTSTNDCKLQPNSVLAANPTKRLSQESSKKRKPISSIASVPPKYQTGLLPIKNPNRCHRPPLSADRCCHCSPLSSAPVIVAHPCSRRPPPPSSSAAAAVFCRWRHRPPPLSCSAATVFTCHHLRLDNNVRVKQSTKSTTQPHPLPSPNINPLVKDLPSALLLGTQSSHWPVDSGSAQSSSLTILLISLTPSSTMPTRQGTDCLGRTQQMKEKQAAELALQQRMEAEHLKHQEEKQCRKDKHRKEGEQRKQLEDAKKEKRPAKAPAAKENAAQVVSPSKPASTDADMENVRLKINLFPIMHGKENGTKDRKSGSPPQNKPKKTPTMYCPPPQGSTL